MLTSTCRIGSARNDTARDGYTVRTFPPSYAPDNTLRGHFEFGLKYDDLNLEWLSRLFEKVEADWSEEWLRSSPTSLYARKTGYLYEWFTGRLLNAGDTPATNYESLVDDERYLCAPRPSRDRRWMIDDNLPGTRDFCPLVRLTQALREALKFDVQAALRELDCQRQSNNPQPW